MPNVAWMVENNKIIGRVLEWANNQPYQINGIILGTAIKVVIFKGTEVTAKGHITGAEITRAFRSENGKAFGVDAAFPLELHGVTRTQLNSECYAIKVTVGIYLEELTLAVTENEVVVLYLK